jgi:hypothetical protein
MPHGPANGNFKHGFDSMHCNPDKQLMDAERRTYWLCQLERVLTGNMQLVAIDDLPMVRRIIENKPTWAQVVLRRFPDAEI